MGSSVRDLVPSFQVDIMRDVDLPDLELRIQEALLAGSVHLWPP